MLKDRMTEATFEWDTRSVADGKYQVRVVASDALANVPGAGKTAARVSDSVLIDNTPPRITGLSAARSGNKMQARTSNRHAARRLRCTRADAVGAAVVIATVEWISRRRSRCSRAPAPG